MSSFLFLTISCPDIFHVSFPPFLLPGLVLVCYRPEEPFGRYYLPLGRTPPHLELLLLQPSSSAAGCLLSEIYPVLIRKSELET